MSKSLLWIAVGVVLTFFGIYAFEGYSLYRRGAPDIQGHQAGTPKNPCKGQYAYYLPPEDGGSMLFCWGHNPKNSGDQVSSDEENNLERDIYLNQVIAGNSKHIEELMGWTIQISKYKAPDKMPVIEFKPESFLNASGCTAITKEQREHCHGYGQYDPKLNVIYVSDRLAGRNVFIFLDAVIVHEMTHYLQMTNGVLDHKTCHGYVANELEAYKVESIFQTDVQGLPKDKIQKPPIYDCEASRVTN